MKINLLFTKSIHSSIKSKLIFTKSRHIAMKSKEFYVVSGLIIAYSMF